MASGTPLADAFVRARVDGRSFGPELNRTIEKTDTSRSGRRMGIGLSKSLGGGFRASIGGALAGGFAKASIGVAAFAAGGALLKRGLLDPASDLNETINKSDTIFGKSAATIRAWADNAAVKLGLSKQAALESAASFGNMFRQLNFNRKAATSMSKAVVQLSADQGSFNNLPTEDVSQRIAAAFRGEFDSLQALIPNINAARVEKEALAATGKKNAKNLTAEEKATAVLAIVTKDGAAATGDFAKTKDAAANASKTLTARFTDMRAELGTKLLPMFTAGIGKVNEFVAGMKDGTGAGGAFAAKVKELTADGKALWSTAKPLVETLGGLLKSLLGLPAPVLAVGAAFVVANSAVGGISGKLGTLSGKFTEAKGASTGFSGAMKGISGVAGGPWTLALTVGLGILGGFIAKHVAAKVRVDSLKESLDKETLAITAATRAQVVDTLQKDGSLKKAREFGVSLKDLTDASLGSIPAQRRVNASLEEYRTRVVGAAAGTRDSGIAGNTARTKIDAFKKSIGSSNQALREAKAAAADAKEALGGLGTAAKRAGANFTAGLAEGIRNGSGAAVAAAEGVARKVAAATRAAMEERSPSRVGIRIGGGFSEGIAIGITIKGKKAVEAVKTLVANVKSHLADLRSQARDISASAAGNVRGILDVSAVGAPGTTPSGVLAGFAAQSQAFAKALAKMARIGLAPAIIAAVAAAGPSALGAANAFASETKAQVRSDNRSVATIDAAARSAGATARASSGIDKKIDATNHILRQLHHALTSGKVGEIEIRNGKVFIKYVNDTNHRNHRRGHQ